MKPKPLEEAERQAQYMAREIEKKLPDGWGFVLLLGSLGEAGNSTYVAQNQRSCQEVPPESDFPENSDRDTPASAT